MTAPALALGFHSDLASPGYLALPRLSPSGAVIRVGRKVLIDESRYFDWLDSMNRRAAA
jgi:hypothetical protein